MKIATILHYCTNDYRFLRRALEECAHFSEQILVSYSDKFFNGEPENRYLLQRSFEEKATFVGFSFDESQLYSPFVHRTPSDEDWLCCWHSTARYAARFFVAEEIDWLFFLDADEIVEGARFAEWVHAYNQIERAVWFYAHMYGLSAAARKQDVQLTGLLVKKDALVPHQILNPQERAGMFHEVRGKKSMAMGLDGKPMIHHYSWVRSKEENMQKSATWAKKDLKNWAEWLQQEASASAENVDPYFDPLSVKVPTGVATPFPLPNFVTRRQILERELYEIL